MPTPKKSVDVEPVKDERYSKQPIIKPDSVKKVAVDGKLTDVQETARYPRNEQSENYRVEVLAPMTGIPTVRISPVGWVGPVPFQLPESRLDELIELLGKIR